MRRKTAVEMAEDHREVSISEFFEKNRHLLGYDNKIKALLIIVKEGVDNALDACEEARILPDLYVKIEEIKPKEKYRIVIRDNGPGILEKQIPKVFGVLLYGSKFHRLRQSRGAQGLGISCAVLYSQLTTGEPAEILSSTGNGKTHRYRLKIDTKNNQPIVLEKNILSGKEWHGVQISFIAEGMYKEHKQSVLEYIKETAISNPYANIVFESPTGKFEFKRGINELPPEPKQIKPHLHGVEIGILTKMISDTRARTIATFFTSEFTRVGKTTAEQICKKAGVDPKISPKRLTDEEVKKLNDAIKRTKVLNPPTNVLSPLKAELIEAGLKKELNPEFVTAISRPPAVYRGWPFQIEVGLAFGGSIQEPSVMRFANRVPLLYKAGDCAITKAIEEIDWRRYGIQMDNKTILEPLMVFVHMCSVWVPYTSESKEAIASYPVIIKEIKLAIQEAGRRLSKYLSGVRRAKYAAERKKIFEKYASETAIALEEMTKEKADTIKAKLLEIVNKRIGEIELIEKETRNISDVPESVRKVDRNEKAEESEEDE